jgi:hypothetical protein
MAYLPLVVLHASVAMRIVGDLIEELGRLRAWGAMGNALAIGLFLATTVRSLDRSHGRAPASRASPIM